MNNRPVNRRRFVKTLGSAAAAAGGLIIPNCGSQTPETPAPATQPSRTFKASSSVRKKPNIIWIVMDTARQDRFSCYGYPRDTTPNIDRIAREGTLYTRAISTSPWTVPTHASMFTGVYPSLHSATGYTPHLDGAYPLIAEVLKEVGYDTAMYSNNPFISGTFGFNWGFDTFHEPRVVLQKSNSNSGDKGAFYTNNLVKEWSAKRGKDKPFFLFINYLEPHWPSYELHEQYLTAFYKEPNLQAEIDRIKKGNLFTYNYVNSGQVAWTARDAELLNNFYDANIRYLDSRVGELVDMFRGQGVLDDTLLIITSDHGENLFDHNLVDHMFCVYNTLVNVPLIIRLPGAFKAGAKENGLVQDVDIVPTIAELAGLNWNGRERLQGASLLKPPVREFALSEYCPFLINTINVFLNSPLREFELHRLASLQKAVVTRDYKFVWRSFGNHELYNLADDPDEKRNLIESDPGRAEEHHTILRDWLSKLPDRPARPGPVSAPGLQITPERERQLRDLGYI